MSKRKSRRRARLGFTMIEQIGLVALTATMILMTTMWIHESMKMSNRFKQRRDSHLALASFSRQFQNDVWRCESMEFDQTQKLLQLNQHTGDQTTYRLVGNAIYQQTLNSGQLSGQQRYELGDEYSIAWDRSDFPKRISLSVFRSDGSTAERPGAEAIAGTDATRDLTIGATANRFGRDIVFGPTSGPTNGAEQ